jgi:DNA-binding GntR family transcriptional regulator
VITPVQREAGDHAANAVHAHLRALILTGAIPPGAPLNQVELAPQLGVSRTPLREAIRMLQKEGLVVAEPQRLARVRGFDPAHLEAVYAQRVLTECLATGMTAQTASDDDVSGLVALLDAMGAHAERRDLDAWQTAHRAFHVALVHRAGTHLIQAMTTHMDRSEHYRLMHQAGTPAAAVAPVSFIDWASGAREHAAIVDAHRRRDGEAAARELAEHLARTALSLIAQLAPAYDPTAIRAALALFHARPTITSPAPARVR